MPLRQYSQHIPVHGICRLLGTPEEDGDLYRDFIFRNFQLAPRDNTVRAAADGGDERLQRDAARSSNARTTPEDDLLTLIAHAEIDGEPVDDELEARLRRR